MNFIELDTLKNILGITEDTHDKKLKKIISETNSLIEANIGDISYREHTERVDGNGNNRIYLKRKPNEIISVIFDKKTLEVDFTQGYMIFLKKPLPKKKKSIMVRYMAGYKNPPAELVAIAMSIAKENLAENFSEIVKNDSALPNAIKQKQLGDLSITYFGNSEMRKNSRNSLSGLDGSDNSMEKIFAKYREFGGLYA